MRLVRERLLLSARRAVIDALLGFSLAAPFAAILAASARLLGRPSLISIAIILPVAAVCIGLVVGLVKVLVLPRKKLAAWLDIHTGARGSLAAAAEASSSPLFSLISEKGALALKTAGLRYLAPFLPAWVPLVLAAAALWGMAFLIPQTEPSRVTSVEYADIAGGAGGASPENHAAAESEWTRLLFVRVAQSAPDVSTPEISLPRLPELPAADGVSKPNSSPDASSGSATTARDTASKSGSAPANASGASATASAESTAPGRASIADSPLPARWRRVVTEYERLLHNESALK